MVSNRSISFEPHNKFGELHYRVAEKLLSWAGPMGLDVPTIEKVGEVIKSRFVFLVLAPRLPVRSLHDMAPVSCVTVR
jgi:hypothetical protein